MFRLLKSRDYSRAELAYVAKELPFDPDASHNYGRGLNPADAERLVSEHRKLRARLQQKLTSKQRDDLIASFPDQIAPDAFHCCGFTGRDDPLWRYAPNVDAEPKPPQPDAGAGDLDPDQLPGAHRSGDGTADGNPLADFLNVPTE